MGGQHSSCCCAEKESDKLVSALPPSASTDEAYGQSAAEADAEPGAFKEGAAAAAASAGGAAAGEASPASEKAAGAEASAGAAAAASAEVISVKTAEEERGTEKKEQDTEPHSKEDEDSKSKLLDKEPPEVEKSEPAAEAKAAQQQQQPALVLEGDEFRVHVERSLEANIGLNLDALDEESAFVDGILPGAIQAWNDEHPDEPQLRRYDRILGVNVFRGHTDCLLREMRQSASWDLAVQRPAEVRISVDCARNPKLGLDLKYSPNGGSLLISNIGEGAIEDWNAASDSYQIGRHDRIVEVNGVRGTARQLLDTATNVATLDLVVMHFA